MKIELNAYMIKHKRPHQKQKVLVKASDEIVDNWEVCTINDCKWIPVYGGSGAFDISDSDLWCELPCLNKFIYRNK